MKITLNTYTFDECYVPVKDHVFIYEEKDLIVQKLVGDLQVPEVDNSILHAVLTIYMTQHQAKTPRDIARQLKVDTRAQSLHLRPNRRHVG